MGWMRHHAIVVSSWNSELLIQAHKKATEIFPWVSPISPVVTNGYQSFFISPDGSKEGWEESLEGDRRRDTFIDYLYQQEHEDGSNSLGWVGVQYDDDNLENLVVRSSDSRFASRLHPKKVVK